MTKDTNNKPWVSQEDKIRRGQAFNVANLQNTLRAAVIALAPDPIKAATTFDQEVTNTKMILSYFYFDMKLAGMCQDPTLDMNRIEGVMSEWIKSLKPSSNS